ncbi:MAG: DUF2089 domain-containing protein [Clostridia bacterium]|nr:DUF2089 domain-containing protein [Clostridia bacterium]MBN2883280.1 DUF2089 domain-containing protein [Clostridia bacterium]
MAKYKAPGKCPVCDGEFAITKLTCSGCGSELSGYYQGCKFCSLSDEDQYFIEIFIKNRGSIKEVEKELGISYPTVRGKLDDVIRAMGYKPVEEPDVEVDHSDILKKLEDGEITPQEATALIKERKKGI